MSLGEYIGAGASTTKLLLHLNGNSTDSSGNGNNGTDTNITYSQANGRFGQGAGLNGSSSYIIVPNSAKGGNSVTVSAWVKINSLTGGGVVYMESGLAYCGIEYTASGALTLDNKTSLTSFSNFTTSGGLLTTDTWYNLVYVYDSSSGFLSGYINGNRVINQSRGGNQLYYSETNSNSIGSYTYNNGASHASYVNGAIDEVIIENRAWTAEEVKKYYTHTKGRFATL